MALDQNGKLIEEMSSTNRPYVAIEKGKNARRSVLVDGEGNTYHLDAKIKDYFKGATGSSHTFSKSMKGITLSNDGSADLVLVVNGINIDVYVGEVFEGRFDPFTSLQVQGSSSYRGYVTD
jgi:hypothetical protein